MDFSNDMLRIGTTGAQKELFMMKSKNGKERKGKREELPEYFSKLELNAYEFPAGRMSKFADSPIYEKFRKNAQKYNLVISMHAPYYISLTSNIEEIYNKSIERVAHCYAWATYLNANRIIIHPGSYGKYAKKMSPSQLINGTKTNYSNKLIKKITEGLQQGIQLANEIYPELKIKFRNICICPETMGKHGQLGPSSEIIEICKNVGINKARPCIDFGHLYARSLGKNKGRNLYENTFKIIEDELGSQVLNNLHIHYSKIEYTSKGEKKHVNNANENWGPEILPLLEIIYEQNLTPTIINESPELETDAQLIMKKYKEMINN